MKSKPLVVLMIIVLISTYCISFNCFDTCKADVLPKFYVDNDYDSTTPGWQVDHFDNIQDAIDASQNDGDRIVVYNGTYRGLLTIDHQLDLFGEDKDTTVIDGEGFGDVITIDAENVNISHFTIKNREDHTIININSGSGHNIITDNIIRDGEQGISISNCDYNTIYDNTITSNSGDGIELNYSDNNDITYNTITSNSNGLFLYSSSYNRIENNTAIQSNTKNGIFLNETSNSNPIWFNIISSNAENGVFLNDHCDDNVLSYNNIYSNDDSGVRCENSSDNTIANSIISTNENYGIMVVGSWNEISNNTINSNGEHGIFLFADDNNDIIYNTISGNTKDGISLSNSTEDLIYSNEVSYNDVYGINLDFFTMSNTIYNNYFHDNTKNSMDKSINHNTWSIDLESGPNIVDGPYISGNYWDDFDENSEGAIDTTDPEDGIADAPYTIYASNKDNGPLLDIILPTMDTPQVSPIAQKIGSYTYIYVNVTDSNTEIKAVYLNITNPNGQTSNFSITQNKTGDTYYCNKQFSPIGTFTFHIAAKDRRNWINSSEITFNINKGIPPTIRDNTVTTGYASKFFTFNATVTDDADEASQLTVKVNWTHKNKGENSSMTNVRGDFFENSSVELDNSTEDLIYTIYASDYWGNSITTAEKTVKIIDNEPPDIAIETYGPSLDYMPNKYTFGATITDNTEVADAYIEYWYTGGGHITARMDGDDSGYYEKNIQLDRTVDRVYCIITATDILGNQNDTKKPFANANGPYIGIVAQTITFKATNSFDLDGYITDYAWEFGDGTTGSGEKPKHTYSANGDYPVTLTVTDNDGNKDYESTYIAVIESIEQETSYSTMVQIEENFSVSLDELFYSYDSDGDLIVDTFIDPNDVLKAVHSGYIDIDDNVVFLLSVNDEYIPEFMWNSTTDEITPITYREAVSNVDINEENERITLSFSVNKSNWIWIDIDLSDITNVNGNFNLSNYIIEAEGRTIFSNRTWMKNNRIYVLDDPDTNYLVTFTQIYPAVHHPSFYPVNYGDLGENQKSITIIYNVPVDITHASFGSLLVTSELVTTNNKVFTYTPPGYLEMDEYSFEINARAVYGTSEDSSSVTYIFEPYMSAPPPPEKSFIENNLWWIFLVCVIGVGGISILIFRLKEITLESYVYIKNKKIAPFFKPIVFGPLNIDVDDKNVSKAEIYLNGKLKTTLTQSPYVWKLDEPAFSKQKIETKVYDQDGNPNSSGEMTFFVFNRPRSFE